MSLRAKRGETDQLTPDGNKHRSKTEDTVHDTGSLIRQCSDQLHGPE